MIWIICLAILILYKCSFAQAEIKGKVIDADKKLALPFAVIKFKGKSPSDMQTDAKGNFDFLVPEGVDSVKFFYIGYTTQMLAVKKNEIQQIVIGLKDKPIPPVY